MPGSWRASGLWPSHLAASAGWSLLGRASGLWLAACGLAVALLHRHRTVIMHCSARSALALALALHVVVARRRGRKSLIIPCLSTLQASGLVGGPITCAQSCQPLAHSTLHSSLNSWTLLKSIVHLDLQCHLLSFLLSTVFCTPEVLTSFLLSLSPPPPSRS